MPAWLRYMLWFGLLGPVIGYAIGVLAMIVAPGPSSGEGIVLFLIFAVEVAVRHSKEVALLRETDVVVLVVAQTS